jgi:hypothetical protein
MRKILTIGAVVASMTLTGCASILSNNHQTIAVNPTNSQGVKCLASNGADAWELYGNNWIIKTSGSSSDIVINCYKGGKLVGSGVASSSVKGIVWANILFFLIPGMVVDFASGAAYEYQSLVPIYTS